MIPHLATFERQCKQCGNEFTAHKHSEEHCSGECIKAAVREGEAKLEPTHQRNERTRTTHQLRLRH